MFSLPILGKISTLFRALKSPAISLGLACAGLVLALYIQHQKLEIERLKNNELKSRIVECQQANNSASDTIARLQEVQKQSEKQRQEALKKQREMLEKLYAPKKIQLTSKDECANTLVPDDVRLRFKTDN